MFGDTATLAATASAAATAATAARNAAREEALARQSAEESGTKMSHHKLMRLRPTLQKNAEEEAAAAARSKLLPFDLPRKTCRQMSPAVAELASDTNSNVTSIQRAAQHRWHILKRLMKRARLSNIDTAILPRLVELDRADSLVADGEVSRKLYCRLFHSRDFNLYGQLVPSVKQPPRKHLLYATIAADAGIEYTQQRDETLVETRVMSEEEETTAVVSAAFNHPGGGGSRLGTIEEDREVLGSRIGLPKIVTEAWKIGEETRRSYAPVGLANNPAQPSNSLGNEQFFSYDGDWRGGKMEGVGRYLFEDRSTYTGEFVANQPHGQGETIFYEGQVYRGDWDEGHMSGKGVYTTPDGVSYEGHFWRGQRSGHGRLTYPSGMYYEGEFLNGKPHGRGRMESKLTGWAYEGTFEKGYINGSGTIITPPPKCQRIVYFWSAETRGAVTLPTLIRNYIESLEQASHEEDQRRNDMNSVLCGIQLKDYVRTIRTDMYNTKMEEKTKKFRALLEKSREQKTKLQEARLDALAPE